MTCDHASNRVPAEISGGDLGIAPEDMAAAHRLGRRRGRPGDRAWPICWTRPAILSDFSRLVIDPNRGEDDPTLVDEAL